MPREGGGQIGNGDRRMAETGRLLRVTCGVACSGDERRSWEAYSAFQVLPSWLTQTWLLSFTISKAGAAD